MLHELSIIEAQLRIEDQLFCESNMYTGKVEVAKENRIYTTDIYEMLGESNVNITISDNNMNELNITPGMLLVVSYVSDRL